MPMNKSRRCYTLDWAIYLHEIETKVFNGALHHSPNITEPLPPCDEVVFQSLISKSQHPHSATRAEAAKGLACTGNPAAVKALIGLLKDESHTVCWAAINSLISLRRAAVRPLVEEITRDFQSTCFLKAAHHILEVLHQHGDLAPAEVHLLHCLCNSHTGFQIAQIANDALIQGAVTAAGTSG